MSERPSDDGRTSRSDAASRLAALLADVAGDEPGPVGAGSPAAPPAGARPPGVPEPPASPAPVRDDIVTAEGAEDEAEERDDQDLPPEGFDLSSLDRLLGGDDPAPRPPPRPAAPRARAGEADASPAPEPGPEDDDAATDPTAPVGATASAESTAPVDATARPVATPPDPGLPEGDDPVLDEARRSAEGATRAGRDDGGPPDDPPSSLHRGPARQPVPAVVPAPTVGPPPFDDEADDDPSPASPPASATAATGGGGTGVRLPRVTVRAVAFGVVLTLLVAAVPVLGWVGLDRIGDSRGGQVVEGTTDRTEAGYRALVEPTPTALVVHRDPDGDPSSATLLSLGAGATGGNVLQVPLTTRVRVQRLLVNTLEVAWSATHDEELFVREVEDRLGLAVQETSFVDDADLADLIAPVAPLPIDNPDEVLADDGQVFPSGAIELSSDDIGPFLRGGAQGEPELARLARNEIVWATWLAAVGEAGTGDSVGAATTGIGPFLRVLAEGAVDGSTVVETLEVTEDVDATGDRVPLVPTEAFGAQVIDAVPYPLSPRQGIRFTMKLLNGADGSELPRPLMRDLMLAGASLATLGNANELGQEGTTIEISDESWREGAEAARFVLGAEAEISVMSAGRAEAEGADMVVTVGRDVLDRLREGSGDG